MRKILHLIILSPAMMISGLHAQDPVDLLILNRQSGEALQRIDEQIGEAPQASLYLKKGIVLSNSQNYQEAVDAFLSGLELEPGHNEIPAELADAYAALGNHHDARPYYETAVKRNPGNLLLTGKLGRNYIQLNEYGKAFRVFSEVYAADSSNVAWNKQLAYCAYQTGRTNQAIGLYEKVIEMNPGDYSSYINLIKLYQQTEQHGKKLELADKGLVRFRGDAGLYHVKAIHFFTARQYEDAKQAYEDYFAAGGDSAYKSLLNYGISLYFSGKEEKAITMLDKCLSQVANDPYVLFYLALSHKKLVHYEIAEAYIQAAIESATPAYLSDMYHHLGQIFGQQRKFEESVAALKKANELDPANFEVLFEIATTYEEFNSNKTLALNYYNIYLKEAGGSARNTNYALERMGKLKEDLFFEK